MGELWRNYDIEGNGMLDSAEARHFLDNHLKNDYCLERLSDSDFDLWFRQIDKDGDGKVDTVQLALAVQPLVKKLKGKNTEKKQV